MKEITSMILGVLSVALVALLLYLGFGTKEKEFLSMTGIPRSSIYHPPFIGIAENGDFELLQVTEQGYLLCQDVDGEVYKLVPYKELVK